MCLFLDVPIGANVTVTPDIGSCCNNCGYNMFPQFTGIYKGHINKNGFNMDLVDLDKVFFCPSCNMLITYLTVYCDNLGWDLSKVIKKKEVEV